MRKLSSDNGHVYCISESMLVTVPINAMSTSASSSEPYAPRKDTAGWQNRLLFAARAIESTYPSAVFAEPSSNCSAAALG
jgi:hypothetical protein